MKWSGPANAYHLGFRVRLVKLATLGLLRETWHYAGKLLLTLSYLLFVAWTMPLDDDEVRLVNAQLDKLEEIQARLEEMKHD